MLSFFDSLDKDKVIDKEKKNQKEETDKLISQ